MVVPLDWDMRWPGHGQIFQAPGKCRPGAWDRQLTKLIWRQRGVLRLLVVLDANPTLRLIGHGAFHVILRPRHQALALTDLLKIGIELREQFAEILTGLRQPIHERFGQIRRIGGLDLLDEMSSEGGGISLQSGHLRHIALDSGAQDAGQLGVVARR